MSRKSLVVVGALAFAALAVPAHANRTSALVAKNRARAKALRTKPSLQPIVTDAVVKSGWTNRAWLLASGTRVMRGELRDAQGNVTMEHRVTVSKDGDRRSVAYQPRGPISQVTTSTPTSFSQRTVTEGPAGIVRLEQ